MQELKVSSFVTWRPEFMNEAETSRVVVFAGCTQFQSPSHTDTVGGASAEVVIRSPQRRLVDALEFDLTKCDSSEDGVSSRVEVRSHIVQGTIPATWSTIPVVQRGHHPL